MLRNSSEKSSISDASSFTRAEVVVEVDRRNRREQPGGRGNQRLGDARRDDARLVEPVAPMPWNAAMMPHTVPNSPMYGVMLAVVARNGMRPSSLFTSTVAARSSARSSAGRLLSVGARGAGAGAPARRLAQLRVELGVTGLEDADQRALVEVLADGLHFGELAAAAEDVEKRRRLALGAC